MMASTRRRAPNQDLPRQPSLISTSSLSPLMADNAGGSINMDEIFKNICSDSNPNYTNNNQPPTAGAPDHGPPLFHAAAGTGGDESMVDVFREIVAGDGRKKPSDGREDQTLEDFLGVGEPVVESVAVAVTVPGPSVLVNGGLVQPQGQLGVVVGGGGGGGGGRGKRRAGVQEEPPVDKATQQKQRRMIKNRESAARSRERKQAYTAELEALVTQLEEEKAELKREEDELKKENQKKLMKILIPVTEGRPPQKTLSRTRSL